MHILSIDVGIGNLAMCLLNDTKEIIFWEVLNIGVDDVPQPNPVNKTKCSLCKNNSKYSKGEKHYCLKHAKETEFLIPTGDLLPSKISKMKLTELVDIIECHSIEDPQKDSAPKKKTKQYYNDLLLSKLLVPDETRETNVKVSEVDMITISRIMTKKLTTLLESYPHITLDHVIIENQISPIATRMTTVQGMLTQYFIMKHPTVEIKYISAKNKLKEFDVEKDNYKDRKKGSIDICKTILSETWCEFLSKHKKKDDLADCYLQGIWYITNKIHPPVESAKKEKGKKKEKSKELLMNTIIEDSDNETMK